MYKDANEVLDGIELPGESYKFKKLMEEIPKHNKKKKFKDGHIHVKNYKKCLEIIERVENEKLKRGDFN